MTEFPTIGNTYTFDLNVNDTIDIIKYNITGKVVEIYNNIYDESIAGLTDVVINITYTNNTTESMTVATAVVDLSPDNLNSFAPMCPLVMPIEDYNEELDELNDLTFDEEEEEEDEETRKRREEEDWEDEARAYEEELRRREEEEEDREAEWEDEVYGCSDEPSEVNEEELRIQDRMDRRWRKVNCV